MKKIKSIVLGLLTLILSFCFINNIFAQTKGSIVVNGTKEDKIYEIYKIFNLTYSGNKVAYTIDSDFKTFFENEGIEYLVSTNTGSLNRITVDSQTKYINITEDNIEKFTKDMLEYVSKNKMSADKILTANTSTLTFENLDLGYYLVYPRGATNILDGNVSICSITSTLPNAEVNIKADYPTIDKEVDDQNAEVGQLVEFTITGLVPDTTGYTTYTYKIQDTMTSGLELDESVVDFKVKFVDDTTDKETEIEIKPIYNNNGFTLTFDMTDYQDYVGQTIVVTYKARVTEEAVNSTTTKNSATLTYSNDPKENTTTTTTPIEVPVYSSQINVTKVDASDNTIKLSGASFVLKNSKGLYYQAKDIDGNIITNTTSTSNVVLVSWVESLEQATVLVTDSTGIITFEGIENGIYNLIEIEAPEGYNKLTGPVEIKVGYNDEGTNLINEADSHNEIVENNSGTALPSTGGIGTKIFIIVGSLLVLLSSIILITNKRISKEK